MKTINLSGLTKSNWLFIVMALLSINTIFSQTSKKAKAGTKESLAVVKGFFEAINSGDMIKARTYMADNHQYVGPMFSTSNPEDFFKALGEFEMEFAVETQDLIGYKNSVTHVSILKVVSPVQASIPCCEVFDIENGKIVRQRFFFDTALFPKP